MLSALNFLGTWSLPRFVSAAALLAGVGLAAVAGARLDDSGSGFSDVWEAAFGAAGLEPDGDADGDGFTNREEAIAGTNPFDPRSRPGGLDVRREGGHFHFQWPTVPGVGYRVEASGDFAEWHTVAPVFVGTGQPATLVVDPAGTHLGPGADYSLWNLDSGGIHFVRNLAANGTTPDETALLERLEIAQSQPNRDNFGQWMRGWIVPPVTGAYTFRVASDDQAEFRLSTDASPANAVAIAGVTGWTAFREWTKYPSQISAPVELTAGQPRYFEVFHREWSGGDHISVAWTPPGAESWEIIGSPHLFTTPLSLADLADGGPVFFRLAVHEVDSDGDGLTDYEEILLGLDPHNATTTPQRPDFDTARAILASANEISLSTVVPRTYETPSAPAVILVQRAGGIAPLTIFYSVSGTATEGVDFAPLPGSVDFGPGQRRAYIQIHALPDDLVEPREEVTLHLLAGSGYEIAQPASATVFIDDAPDVLYVGTLRPDDPSHSGGAGTAALRRAGNSLAGAVSLTFSGLAGKYLGAELYLSANGQSGPVLYTFPPDQVSPTPWDLVPEGALDKTGFLAALQDQQVWARVRTDTFPEGELRGRLTMHEADSPPAPHSPAPPAPTYALTAGEAARFLTQATFGPSAEDTANLTGTAFSDWIDAQMALPPTRHLPGVQARRAELLARFGNDGYQRPRQEIWWEHALGAPDQLRQRMAFALSQIFVISQEGVLDNTQEGVTLYYDILVEEAFGNYRDLLERITLSPMMGRYLSMMRNRKPNPQTGHEPDENYAREIMQLFSIGLNRLHPDGSLVLDEAGFPIPTYTQEDTVGLAHVFTGWGPHYDSADPPRWSNGSIAQPADWFRWGYDDIRPMTLYPEIHDTEDRTIFDGIVIPGNLDGTARLQAALDALHHHPNTGPFLARQLIQRFVTSNPSPAYIERVATAFADNGEGVRGDLGAMLRAVLLDYEARHPHPRTWFGFGKPTEPLLRMSRLLRFVPPQPPLADEGDHRLFLNLRWNMPEQAPLHAASVFNFFQPVYSAPGAIARAGLLSPELQIFAETTAIRQANLKFGTIHWGIWTAERDAAGDAAVIRLDFTTLRGILDTPGWQPLDAEEALIDHLDDHLLFGAMSADLRGDLLHAFALLPAWFDHSPARQTQRVQMALWLVLNSPDFFVQR